MADGAADLCVCVLFYGEDAVSLPLAQRVLNGPMRELARHNVEFRFGFNAVGEGTKAFVRESITQVFHTAMWIEPEQNIFKYPMMRRLLYGTPVTAPATMWFDDDSCLAADCDVASWLPRALKLLESYAMVGSLYRQRLLGNQAAWIKSQPWYAGKPISPYIKFVTGGWWAIQTKVLQRYDWPVPQLRHRGGDVMLGALCEQQALPIGHFRDKVWINANEAGVESKSPRRGFDEKPIGYDYVAPSAQPQALPREYLLSRGSCCGSQCANCPYHPPHARGATEVNHETGR
jgi:hypothetical protein